MALLNRLFGNGRKKSPVSGRQTSSSKTSDEVFESTCGEPPSFNKDQIRVLVFRECEWRGRKLLFDWHSVRRTEPGQTHRHKCSLMNKPPRRPSTAPSTPSKSEKCVGYVEVTQNGTAYQYLRPQADVKMLGEMIFGSVAMSYKGETMKMHTIRSPPQIMFSKVTPAPMHRRNGNGHANDVERDLDGSGSFQNFISECIGMRPNKEGSSSSLAHSVPVDVPAQFLQSSLGRVNGDDDILELLTTTPSTSLRSNSSFSSVMSLINGNGGCGGGQRSPFEGNSVDQPSSDCLNRSGSLNSLHRRWHRTMTTSIEFGLNWSRRRMIDSNEDLNAGLDKERKVSGGYGHRTSSPLSTSSSSGSSRTKLGISVVITMSDDDEHEKHFQTFFFSHIALVESHINRLCAAVEEAYTNRTHFVHLVVQGVERFQQAFYDLYTAPRLPRPVWLSLMSVGSQHHVLCLHFVTEFMTLLELHDTKNTNFFVSTLLTAVLMHHLSWVSTVTPPGILPSHSFHEKHMAKWLDILAKLHPYNPLWVQLGDLYGALGFPCKMAKTIIVGADSYLVRRLLYCLTYFIRCCEVYENVETMTVSPFASHSKGTSSSSSVGESTIRHLSRTFERRSSDFGSLNPNANDLTKKRSSPSVDVEVQQGEGDDDDNDEVEDEVFHAVESNLCETPTLRLGRKSCDKCRTPSCSCFKSNRCGVIYDDSADSIHDLKSADGGQQPVLKNGFQYTSRDSGIQSLIELDKCNEKPPHSPREGGGSRVKRRSARSKVMFSIGNVPLDAMCNGGGGAGGGLDELEDNVLVCTCGKHYPRVGTMFTKREDHPIRASAAGLLMSSVNDRLTRIEHDDNGDSVNCLGGVSNCDGTLAQIPSLACDSGIQSCDESGVDLVSNLLTSRSGSVRALDVCFPQVKLEHVRNVGKSKQTEVKNDDSSLSLMKTTMAYDDVLDRSGSNSVRPRVNLHVDYERTNSMFDEYFDENVELNMLDEESFQETMKQRRRMKCGQKEQQIQPPTRTLTPTLMQPPSPTIATNSSDHDFDSFLDGEQRCPLNDASLMSFDDGSISPSTDSKRKILWKSSCQNDRLEFLENAIELRLPSSTVSQYGNCTMQSDYVHGFSRSLSSNYVDHYLSDFALQGTNERAFGRRLIDDLHGAVQNPSVLDEPVDEAVSIVASVDKWTVELVSSKSGGVDESDGSPTGVRVTTSQLVAGMTESLLHLWKLKMSPEFCLMHLEDRLQEFYFKSRLLAEYLLEMEPSNVQTVSTALGIEASDLPLLLAIASTHSPQVTCTYGLAYR